MAKQYARKIDVNRALQRLSYVSKGDFFEPVAEADGWPKPQNTCHAQFITTEQLQERLEIEKRHEEETYTVDEYKLRKETRSLGR